MLTFITLAVLAAVVVSNAWRERKIQKERMITKAKILALLALIAQLQNTHVTDLATIDDLKRQIDALKANAAELQDPDLVAAVDAVVGNAASTPPPDAA
jgi:hypothetical protein